MRENYVPIVAPTVTAAPIPSLRVVVDFLFLLANLLAAAVLVQAERLEQRLDLSGDVNNEMSVTFAIDQCLVAHRAVVI